MPASGGATICACGAGATAAILPAVLPVGFAVFGARRAGLGQRGGGARGGDDQRRAAGLNSAMGAAQFAGNQLPHARQAVGRRGIGGEKLLGQPHRAQRQADCLLNALVLGEGDLAASAAQVEQQHAAAGSRLCAGDAEMNEPAFFQAGDDFHVPAGFGLDPRLKGRAVAGVAHGRGGHHANLVHSMRLHRALKALERAQRGRHGLRRNQPGLKDAGAEPRHLAILGEGLELMRLHLGDLQPAGVGTDIDGGEGGHEDLAGAPNERNALAKIHDGGEQGNGARDEGLGTRDLGLGTSDQA